MKVEILENRLNKVVFNYLDTKLSGFEQRKGKYYDVVFGFPNEEYGILGWEKSRTLKIYYELVDETSYYFGMESSDIEKIIGEWVEDRYDLKVINTSFFKSPHNIVLLKIDTI
jgi:hypothetical protein